MFYIFLLLSIFSFSSLAFGDVWDSLHRRTPSILFSIFGYLGVISSVIFLVWTQKTLNPGGGPFPVLRWSSAVLFALLLIYSTFIAVRTGGSDKQQAGEESRRVIDTGMYGIVRHPGFYWFTLLIGSLITIYTDFRFIVGGIVLIVLNFFLIFIEDRVLFPKIFPKYREYQEKVPFLLPEVLKRHGE